ncbi:hypothetical protein DV513_25180 [Salmonella enterica subsp. enterica serovar Alachua]|nr:hypothetical protein DV513_25180 [Salmonella enterica subsp. enterica serovar Alachua]
MMSLWDALRMNMMISYQELVRTFLSDMRFLLTRRYDEEYVRGNIFNNSPTRGILLFKLIPKC